MKSLCVACGNTFIIKLKIQLELEEQENLIVVRMVEKSGK